MTTMTMTTIDSTLHSTLDDSHTFSNNREEEQEGQEEEEERTIALV